MQAKTFAVVCFALLSLALLAPHPALAGPVESSVWIEVERADGVFFKGHRLPREGIGAGVMLFSREVVTAAHVVFGANKVSVAGGNGPPHCGKDRQHRREYRRCGPRTRTTPTIPCGDSQRCGRRR
ncbi:MAG: hypothetical protein A3C93_04480 [Candidatus Lloydbacteria bacterium RIFCSPHIGHO2_02_FULL_54_17]|uniref:Peptidase S1 domain-containing protein n=1 Tax=Candidatus Lloydbacteria bacterium RIFCSPHIGHO2_02_FULL_54_17 TaxID=1798664 RepID=A0A1G2DDH8_9BACT|nr:MAG: hypothetical protein A3C93_04480 [Candidatus Lloydbacteria bacterium RIFCSPHIGHO2_02_FULL_54_17]OGZ13947.1 MAG: hypothetical protein A2948_00375 [Candidatus Lloydbacteria bacterium RIFCSPLOWO2_01_FULL_54_18]OGZ15675.1 MAG: hypothetical protein A3H76_05600 [Candidatus Lloydbacteria bacterium RIFCSPLOWO2_02_FULL_54_12]